MGRKRFVAVVIVLLVLIAVTRVLLTYKVTAQGFDEPGHVAAAIELLDHGTYTLDPLHPPLTRIAIGIPLYLAGERFPNWPASDPRIHNYHDVGNSVLYDHGHYLLSLSLAHAAVLPFFVLAVGASVFLDPPGVRRICWGNGSSSILNPARCFGILRSGLHRYSHGLHAVYSAVRVYPLAGKANHAIEPSIGGYHRAW